MTLEKKLVALRKAKGLSQLKLAEMMDVSRQAISRWEVGAAVPSIENLKYLGSLYNVPLEYLLNDDAPEPVNRDHEPKEEKPQGASTNRKIVALVFIVIGVLAVMLCTIFFMNRDRKPNQMDDFERSGIETDNTYDIEGLDRDIWETTEAEEADGFSMNW